LTVFGIPESKKNDIKQKIIQELYRWEGKESFFSFSFKYIYRMTNNVSLFLLTML
jgi:hypothetical protein